MRVRPALVGVILSLTSFAACSAAPPDLATTTSAPPSTSASVSTTASAATSTPPTDPTALPAGFRSVCSMVDPARIQKALDIVAPVLSVAPTISSTAQPPSGDTCSYVGTGPNASEPSRILSVTVGAQSDRTSLEPLMGLLAQSHYTLSDVDGLGVPAKESSPGPTLWVLTGSRVVSLSGRYVKVPELKAAAALIAPAVPGATAPLPRISLRECDTWDALAEKVTGSVTVRRDEQSSTSLQCGVAGPRNTVYLRREARDPAAALADDERFDGPHPVSGLPGSYWSEGSGLVAVSSSAVVHVIVYPAVDDPGGIALLRALAASG